MYVPRGYRKPLAVELARLVVEAYRQFESDASDSVWEIPKPYSLIKELRVESDSQTKILDLSHWLGRLTGRTQETAPLGFVARRGRTVFVIFRGTKTPEEWLSNTKASLTAFPRGGTGQVHSGFLTVYQSLRPALLEGLQAAGGKEMFVAGHSLGAALATLLAADLDDRSGRQVKAVYLFGSPRVGDDEFVQGYNRRCARITYRISNTADVVTAVPLPVPMVGPWGGYFSHVDTPVDFTRQDNNVLKNHRMETYREEVTRAKEGFLARLFRGP